MTATERLRELLDERGVEYRFNDATKVFEWHFDGTDGEGSAHATEVNGGVNIIACSLTPEQAIVATLGAGTCWLHDCDGSFSSVSRPVWRCDCGAFMTQYTDATTYHKPRFCPNCGRRVVSE